MKKYLKYLFGLFSFGLTLISMQSGFYFYKILFGVSTAILATGVFEILRLATLLYLSLNLETQKKAVAGVLYVLVALICAFAATSSFHARIIESYQRDLLPYTTEMKGRAGVIQQKYAQIYAEKIVAVEEKIDICKKRTILEPSSTYWPNRLAQVLEERHAIIAERDSLISSVSEDNLGEWVSRHAAITGVSFEALPLSRLGAAAITEAVHELWNIGELSVKKLMAMAIVLAIEIGIILLAIFARIYAIEASEKEKKSMPVHNHQYAAFSGETGGTPSKWPVQPSGEQLPQGSNGRPVESPPDFINKEERIIPATAISNTQQREENGHTTGAGSEGDKHKLIEEIPEAGDGHGEKADPDTNSDVNKAIMEKLRAEFRENDIEAFLKQNIPFFKETGKLIPARKLNRRLQPIRNVLSKEFTKEELQNFFDPFEEFINRG